ncbi:MAG: DUF1476 domain-containing protein [Methylocystaceae bacterium]|nr:DUF1476 domain-containing protein [Methylocystaceae bacterium]
MNDIASVIKQREQAFEAQYKLDEEHNFKIRARRDRFFGTWAAEKIGLDGTQAEKYAIEAAQIDLEAAGDANLIDKVVADIKEAGKTVSNDELLAAMTDALQKAQQTFKEDFPEALSNDHHL